MDIQNVSNVQNVQHVKVAKAVKSVEPKVCLDVKDDVFEISGKKTKIDKPSTGKKVGVGIASAAFPGLGQLINGQGKKAAGHFLGNIAVKVATVGLTSVCPPLGIVGGLGALALNIYSIVDAVKNAK